MKKTMICLLALGIILSLAACDAEKIPPSLEAEQGTHVAEQMSPRETQETAAGEDDGAVLKACVSLLGKTDEETKELLGGGEENMAADGSLLIGRIYQVHLFGEDLEAGTIYDENQRVKTVSFQLEGEDGTVYEQALTELLGNPTGGSNDTSEGGEISKTWNCDGSILTLHQMYGLVSMELNPMP